MRDYALDSPETLLGQLQRGLGRGFLASMRGRVGKDELLNCVLHDPRSDPQLEERASYYAKLAIESELAVEAVAKAVRAANAETVCAGLPAEVLMEMAVRGRNDALVALREELRQDGWLQAVLVMNHAEHQYGHPLMESDDITSIAGRDAEELERIVVNLAHLPWQHWATSEPRLQTVMLAAHTEHKPSLRLPAGKPDTAMSTSALLRIAEPRNAVRVVRVLAQRTDAASVATMIAAGRGMDSNQRLAGLGALGAQAHTGLLEYAAEVLEAAAGRARDVRTPAMLRYLEALPPEATLPRARQWLNQVGRASVAAEHILARHARTEDRELVESSLANALEDDATFRACSMVDALTVIADSRSAEVLVQTFERLGYSRARPRVLRALERCCPEAVANLAIEALWDCESEARRRGAHMTLITEETSARLREIQGDMFEDERTRIAARRC
ncbi:MAG: hypothetical protein GXP55_26470 [Deltaproteobacteria bacterium]|nr:hypothetical protein [Deltaproteobacteria bacterium]